MPPEGLCQVIFLNSLQKRKIDQAPKGSEGVTKAGKNERWGRQGNNRGEPAVYQTAQSTAVGGTKTTQRY